MLTPELSLSLFTQFGILMPIIKITEKEKYYVVRCDSIPDFIAANTLLIKEPITTQTLSQWESVFLSEFSEQVKSHHVSFVQIPLLPNFQPLKTQDAQYTSNIDTVLSASQIIQSPSHRTDLEIRALKDKTEFKMLCDHMSAMNQSKSEAFNKRRNRFIQTLFSHHENWQHQQRGTWYGVFEKQKLIASCGLYPIQGFLRFQEVVVSKEYRNQKIATTLIARSAELESQKQQINQFVIVAEAHSYAERMYKNLGFQELGYELGCFKKVLADE